MLTHRRLWTAGMLAFAAAACGGLSASEEKFAEIPAGTGIAVLLEGGVDTRTSRAGQLLAASVEQPITVAGAVVVPAGAVARGTIMAISQKPPSMTVQFDEIEIAGATHALATRPTIVQLVEHSEMRDEGAKIGGGAAAGAVLGGVIGGDVKGAAIGAAAGAAAGTGVAMATKARWAYLPAGARLHLRLDESLSLPLPPEGESLAE